MRLIYPLLWSRPDRRACGEQSINTIAALARQGVDVTLLMPQGKRDPALTPGDLRAWFEVEGDFRLVQRPSRWAGEMMFYTALWLRQVYADPLLREADLMFSRIPWVIARGGKCPIPFATDHYRPWPDDWPWLRYAIRRTALVPRSLGLILHSDYAAASYRRIGVPEAKILVAHNGADPERMLPRLDKAHARVALGLPEDRAIALYAGRVNAEKGLDQLLALARLRPEVLFVLVGSEGEGVVEAAARTLANVRVVPWQPPGALAAWLYAADVLLIPASQAPLERFGTCVLPLKTFAYLAAGRPILAPRSPDTAEMLRDGENALLVRPGDPAAAAAALDRLLHEPGLAGRLGAGAEASAAALTWDQRARRIIDFLEAGLEAMR